MPFLEPGLPEHSNCLDNGRCPIPILGFKESAFGFNGRGKHLLGTLYHQLVKGTTANEACIASPGVGLCG